jgi:hypothetical protein
MRAKEFLIFEHSIREKTLTLRKAIMEALNQPLMEINFNDSSLVKQALNSKSIQCGFEAETIWPGISGVEEPDWDSIEWQDIINGISGRQESRLESNYSSWIDDKASEYLDDAVEEWVKDNYEDYKNDYISLQADDEYNEFATEHEDEDWSYDETVNEFIEENRSEYKDWLREQAMDDSYVIDEARRLAEEYYSQEDWAIDVYGSIIEAGREYGFQPDLGEGNGIEEVAEIIEQWAQEKSKFSQVKHGEYHSYAGSSQSFWRVELDSSLTSDEGQQGAEIISPVYDSPQEMLAEMNDLFTFMNKWGVQTDSETGLHVTMSWVEDQDYQANKLKMVLLLGDQYLLKQFNRHLNSYTTSQYEKVAEKAASLADNPNDKKSLKELEQELGRAVSAQKYSSVHFKNMYNDAGNQLIEFRIAGNEDYIKNFGKIEKTVSRYALAMIAGYDPQAFEKDYIKALVKVVNSRKDPISQGTQKIPDSAISKILPNFITPSAYNTIAKSLASAYEYLNLSKEQRAADPQLDMFNEDANLPEWQQSLKQAQANIAEVIAMMVANVRLGTNKQPITSNIIFTLRNTLKEFGLTTATLWPLILNSNIYKTIEMDPHQKEESFNKTLRQLLKTDVGAVSKPAFTIQYNPREELVFMLLKAYDAAVNDDVEITLKPEHFKVVSELDYNDIRRYTPAYFDRLRQIKDLEKILGTFSDPATDYDKIRQYERLLQDAQDDAKFYLEQINRFKTKYGFSMFDEEGRELYKMIGNPTFFAKNYNIKFDRV